MNSTTHKTENKDKIVTKPLGIGLLACLCCFLWGSATPAIKIGYEWFGIGTNDLASRILFAGVRSKLENENGVPEAFKGVPLTLITAAMLSLAFMGFSGLFQ